MVNSNIFRTFVSSMRDKQRNPKILKRVGKTKTRMPYESHDFFEDLESQNEIRSLDLTTKGRGNPPTFGFSVQRYKLILNYARDK